MEIETFRERLAATIAWCRPRFALEGPRVSLRSAELLPSTMSTAETEMGLLQHTLAVVAERRSAMVGSLDFESIERGGRLFGFFPRDSLPDGFSETETRGFFDVKNTPPWDSWVCIVEDLLVSWVPSEMIEEVQVAIDCNAEECMAWLSDIESSPFVSQLKRHRLVW